jgi:hypothetical protein
MQIEDFIENSFIKRNLDFKSLKFFLLYYFMLKNNEQISIGNDEYFDKYTYKALINNIDQEEFGSKEFVRAFYTFVKTNNLKFSDVDFDKFYYSDEQNNKRCIFCNKPLTRKFSKETSGWEVEKCTCEISENIEKICKDYEENLRIQTENLKRHKEELEFNQIFSSLQQLLNSQNKNTIEEVETSLKKDMIKDKSLLDMISKNKEISLLRTLNGGKHD